MNKKPLWQRLSLRRSLFDYTKVQGFVGKLKRNRPGNIKARGLILDVGCGPNSRPENINLDWWWTPKIDICADITKGIPLPDNYVRGIFSEHCIEHVDLHGGYRALHEFYRVLQPGGAVRIVVPDLGIYMTEYLKAQRGEPYAMPYADNLPGSLWSVDGIITPVQSLNHIMRDHGHLFIYDHETLTKMMEKIGFVQIERASFGQGGHTELIMDTESRAIESLYIEAIKPPLDGDAAP